MHAEGFFEWLGRVFGAFIRFIVDGLREFFALLADAGSSFFRGLTETLGITPSLLGILVLIVGLLLLYAAVRAFLRRSIILGLLWLLLGAWLLGWLVY
jgi:hypothetical protein